MNKMIWTKEHIDYNLCQWVAECSNCKNESQSVYTKVSLDFEYCPHCGAKQAKGEFDYDFQGNK